MKKGMGKRTMRITALVMTAAMVLGIGGLSMTAKADETTYTAYSQYQGSPDKVQADYFIDKGGNHVVSYCLNNNRRSPETGGTTGYKKVAVTPDNVRGLVGTGSSSKAEGQALINKLMGILRNGYPTDAAGLKAKYGVNDKLFRDATQDAIWYYTDGKELGEAQQFLKSFGTDYTEEMISLAATPEGSLDGTALTDGQKDMVTQVRGAVKLYQELKNASVSEEYAKHHTLNIYVTSASGGDAGKPVLYQNMIDVAAITENPKKDVLFSKTAVNGTAELPGATLKVWEGATLIEEWVSTNEQHLIRLYAGEYLMEEITAPEGFLKAESIRFRVTDDMQVQVFENGEYKARENATVHMQDAEKPKARVDFSKTEINGTNELPGAKLIVQGNNVNFRDEWISGDVPHRTWLLPGEYTMTEIQAPDGYEVAENIIFRITEDLKVEIKEGDNWVPRENSTVHMQDAKKPEVTTQTTPEPVKSNDSVDSGSAEHQTSQQPANNAPAEQVLGVERVQPVQQQPDFTQPAAQAPAQQVLGQSRSPQTDDEAPVALLLALFGVALLGVGITSYVWKKSS